VNSADSAPASASSFPIFRLIALIVRRRRLLLLSPLIGALVLGGLALARARTYSAYASFLPQSAGVSSSPLAGLAAQYGFSIPNSSGAAQSPDFYAALLTSREVLEAVAAGDYALTVDGKQKRGNLATLLGISRATSDATMQATVVALKKMLTTNVSRQTGMVSLSVTAPWESLSQQLAMRLLEEVNKFNLNRRRSQASEERRFVESRAESAKAELAAAESRLQVFLQGNRAYQGSPALRFEAERLGREVDLRQSVYAQLQQSYERAKLDEVRDTPVITIVDHPATEPNARGTVLKALLGLLLGGAIGVALALLFEIMSRDDLREREDYAEMVREANNVGGVFGRLLRRR
jgi:uncharacterized protein involved in exopolysaccharide biosynthesis